MKRLALIVLLATLAAACAPSSSGGLTPIEEYTPSGYSVRYRVAGTAKAGSMVWENSQGGTEMGDYNLPWQKSFTFAGGDFVYISAQNQGETGSIICQIWVNGVKWKESTSTGAYSIATCSGSVGRK